MESKNVNRNHDIYFYLIIHLKNVVISVSVPSLQYSEFLSTVSVFLLYLYVLILFKHVQGQDSGSLNI